MLRQLRKYTLGAALLALTGCGSSNVGNLPGPGTDDVAPVIGTVTGVASGDTVSGSVAITAAAADNTAVTSFKCALGATELGTSANGDLSFTWDTTTAANGAASLVFTARDAANNTATLTVNVTVDNPVVADATDPVMGAITGVSEGATVSGTVAITAAATDNVAVTELALTLDGTELASADDGSLSFNWDTTGAADGAHVLVFTAKDAAANEAGATINVTVDNAGGGGGAAVSGVVRMPNGVDPVSGALVYVPSGGASAAAVGDPPGEASYDFDYTGADGAFSLTGIPVGNQTVKILKGAFSLTLAVNLVDGNNVLDPTQTTLPSETGGGGTVDKMLVVTGNYDAIENVLAKLGLGDVNGGGGLVLGTETFDLVDGNNSLPDGDYPNFDAFFATEANFGQYRTIFLNCGNDYEDEFFADTAAVDALKAWVNAGGKLYCTDWSYDYCEQLFPEFVDFYNFTVGGDGLSTTPEPRDEAEAGADMADLLCPVEDSSLLAWLTGLSVDTTGDSINVTDWLTAWSAIEAVAASVKVWVRGNITYGLPVPSTNDRPVTITFSVGSGTVLFSSYHTEASPAPGLTPQDRVLQYLVFEVL